MSAAGTPHASAAASAAASSSAAVSSSTSGTDSPISSSRRNSGSGSTPAASGATAKKPLPKKKGKQLSMEVDPNLPIPGVVNVKLSVEIEALVRTFIPPSIHPSTVTAYDQRFVFTLPPVRRPPIEPGQAAPIPTPEEEAANTITTPATGVWEPVPPAASSSAPAPSVPCSHVRWSRAFDIRLDKDALLQWENKSFDWSIEARSLVVESTPPMFHPDGRQMSPEEAAAAIAEQKLLENASPRSKRKGSASARDKEKEKEAKAKEKEKEKLRKQKEKEKKAKAAKGIPDEPEEPERVSTAHPQLEEDDLPWNKVQSSTLLLSPILFSPFQVSRSIGQCMDWTLLPFQGLEWYSVRIVADKDPMDVEVRTALNPICISLKKVEHLPRDPLPSFEAMNGTYKSVSCKYTFFSSGKTEIVPPPPNPLERIPPGLTGKELKEAEKAAAAAMALAASQPPPPIVTRPVPPATYQTLSVPHAETIRFDGQRVIFLGLFDRNALASQIQSQPLKIELHDRDHRDAWTPEDYAEEQRQKEAAAEAARLAAEALEAKNKKGKKKPGSASRTGTASGDSARKKKAGGENATAVEEKEESNENNEEESGDEEEQPPSALAHLQFKAEGVESMLAQAAAAAAAVSRLPGVRSTAPVFKPRYDASQNVIGVASFNLEDLFRGSTSFELTAPVKPVYPPSHIKLILPQKKVDPYSATVHKHETTVHLSVKLSFPYNSGKLVHESTHAYERAVIAFKYEDSILLNKILSAVALVNTQELGVVVPGAVKAAPRWGGKLNDAAAPPRDEVADTSVALMALQAVRLTPAQLADDSPLDLISSVQVIDDRQRIFILEGKSRHAGGSSMEYLMDCVGRERENLPASSKEFFRMLHHPDITFPNRLYASYHAAPKNIRIKPGVTLQSLAKSNSFYVVPKNTSVETFASFQILMDLLSVPRMRVAMRSNLFPTTLHFAALDKYFGSFLSDVDMYGIVPKLTEVDRYDASTKNSVKLMPEAGASSPPEEIIRPRSRGQTRNRQMERSFGKDLAAIRQNKKDKLREETEQQERQMQMFNQLQAEVNDRNNVAHQYDTTAQFAKTLPSDKLAELDATVSLRARGGMKRDKSVSSHDTASKKSDAEVFVEADTRFKYSDVGRKQALDLDNSAYLERFRAAQQQSASTEFIRKNVKAVRAASAMVASKKSPADYPRYLQPHELGLKEFHVYGNMKLNIYDVQKKLMRDEIKAKEAQSGQEHHYTYCEEFLSASFDKFNVDEEQRNRLLAEKALWKTSEGFRWPAHKTHAESYHPAKDLHPSRVEALNTPPETASTNLAALLDAKGDDVSNLAGTARVAHPDRFKRHFSSNNEFGMPDNPEWGKSIAIVGDAADELMRQAALKEKEEWRRKILVDNPNFKVLWAGSGQVGSTNFDFDAENQRKIDQMARGEVITRYTGGHSAPVPARMAKVDQISNMLRDAPVRPGLQFNKQIVLGTQVETRSYPVPDVPVSMHALSPFVDHNRTIHMRTLEEKERAELHDTPRNPKPRFHVTAPERVHAFVHKRKCEVPTNLPKSLQEKTLA